MDMRNFQKDHGLFTPIKAKAQMEASLAGALTIQHEEHSTERVNLPKEIAKNLFPNRYKIDFNKINSKNIRAFTQAKTKKVKKLSRDQIPEEYLVLTQQVNTPTSRNEDLTSLESKAEHRTITNPSFIHNQAKFFVMDPSKIPAKRREVARIPRLKQFLKNKQAIAEHHKHLLTESYDRRIPLSTSPKDPQLIVDTISNYSPREDAPVIIP